MSDERVFRLPPKTTEEIVAEIKPFVEEAKALWSKQMGKATVTYRELRFVIEDELTQVYVRCDVGGDAPINAGGWYHKTFPPSQPINSLVDLIFTKDDPLLWSHGAPSDDRLMRPMRGPTLPSGNPEDD